MDDRLLQVPYIHFDSPGCTHPILGLEYRVLCHSTILTTWLLTAYSHFKGSFCHRHRRRVCWSLDLHLSAGGTLSQAWSPYAACTTRPSIAYDAQIINAPFIFTVSSRLGSSPWLPCRSRKAIDARSRRFRTSDQHATSRIHVARPAPPAWEYHLVLRVATSQRRNYLTRERS